VQTQLSANCASTGLVKLTLTPGVMVAMTPAVFRAMVLAIR
jgi:hypothetical protein